MKKHLCFSGPLRVNKLVLVIQQLVTNDVCVTSVSLRCNIWNSVSFLWTHQRLSAISSPRLTHTL